MFYSISFSNKLYSTGIAFHYKPLYFNILEVIKHSKYFELVSKLGFGKHVPDMSQAKGISYFSLFIMGGAQMSKKRRKTKLILSSRKEQEEKINNYLKTSVWILEKAGITDRMMSSIKFPQAPKIIKKYRGEVTEHLNTGNFSSIESLVKSVTDVKMQTKVAIWILKRARFANWIISSLEFPQSPKTLRKYAKEIGHFVNSGQLSLIAAFASTVNILPMGNGKLLDVIDANNQLTPCGSKRFFTKTGSSDKSPEYLEG